MKKSRVSPGAIAKVLATLTMTAGLTMYGCSGDTPRSESAGGQFKNISETDSKLLKGNGKVARKGAGAPKSIKGKLADIQKENTAG